MHSLIDGNDDPFSFATRGASNKVREEPCRIRFILTIAWVRYASLTNIHFTTPGRPKTNTRHDAPKRRRHRGRPYTVRWGKLGRSVVEKMAGRRAWNRTLMLLVVVLRSR